jgi:hypothetical protein
LHSTKWSDGKKKLTQDSEGNEENRYPVVDSNKKRYMMPRNPTMLTRTSSRRNPASSQ